MEAEAFGEHARYREQAGPATLFRGKYLSIASYRRDGTEVATPVRFVPEGGSLPVEAGRGRAVATMAIIV